MSELDNDAEMDFSLADLAELDASEIAEVRFESLPAGVYTFRGTEAKFEEFENKDDEKRFRLVAKFEVVECHQVLERGIEKEELVGKKHTEKFVIVPAKAAEGIGLIRAWVGDAGLPNGGVLGGVEGKEPGFVDGLVDHEFKAKIIRRPNKNDPSNPYSSIKLDAKKR